MNCADLTYCQSPLNATHSSTLLGFTFTGKERDEEAGNGYFGARYMVHELMSMWLSVDPMMVKYPNISPYAYCAWIRPTGGDEHRWIKYNIVNNPIGAIDPNGMDSIKTPNGMANAGTG